MKKKIGGLLLVAGMILLLGLVGIWWLYQPIDSQEQTKISFVIPKGQAISVIGKRLADQGLIRHSLLFRAEVLRLGISSSIQAGSFQLSPDMTVTQISRALTEGTDDQWITIVEGWRTEEIAEMLSRQDLLEFDQDEFLSLAQGWEGYMYPDTYLVPKLITSEQLFELLKETFGKKVELGLAEELAASDHDLETVIIMASLVQREARNFEQMRHVASILWNRIELGMPLQVDATLQYVKGYDAIQDSWWGTPLAADKALTSPFNTYLNVGLPPRPISNPGLEAITATLNPIESDDLFYIHDSQGQMHFAATLDEHNANVARYLR